MTPTTNRLRELDFLRGTAILLVLLRHQFLNLFTQNMGWIGVDLFFVLSGFLVSGLLFREYLKFGNIQPGRFLLRRGFKIYPLYYLFYLLYLVPVFLESSLNKVGLISDLTFTQNYLWGFGYAYPASWSLAVEEHFYFMLAFFLWLVFNKNMVKLKVDINFSGISPMEKILMAVMLCCLVLRLITNEFLHTNSTQNITMTHLRIDSLLMGVLIAYLYYFRIDYLKRFFQKYKYLLCVIAFAGVVWTPFTDVFASFFAKTIGFSLLYISFGILLLVFLLAKDINKRLNSIFTAAVVNMVSKIGFSSYSIYIIHTFIIHYVNKLATEQHFYWNNYLSFIVATILSIAAGMLMTYTVEKYFLRMRERFYPARIS